MPAFAAGLWVGLAMHPAPRADGLGVTEVSPRETVIQPVNGIARIDETAAREPTTSVFASSRSAASGATRLTPQDLAERALEFTAFVQSKDVYGSGILLDGDGHVLTCRHVVDTASPITVSFSGVPPLQAQVVEMDTALDLALLKVDEIATDRQAAPRASIETVRVGDEVYAMGAPRKLRFSLSRGLVSYVGRPFSDLFFLQTDLPANGGSSGGPVMNDLGAVVAITSFVFRDTEGLAFALPIEYAYDRFADKLQTATLGRNTFVAWRESMKARTAR